MPPLCITCHPQHKYFFRNILVRCVGWFSKLACRCSGSWPGLHVSKAPCSFEPNDHLVAAQGVAPKYDIFPSNSSFRSNSFRRGVSHALCSRCSQSAKSICCVSIQDSSRQPRALALCTPVGSLHRCMSVSVVFEGYETWRKFVFYIHSHQPAS